MATDNLPDALALNDTPNDTASVAPKASSLAAPSEAQLQAAAWVERTGTRTYRGHSVRGATVEIGPAESGAVFTPGELLQIALAACAGMSSDQRMAIALGPDFKSTIRAIPTKNPYSDRYSSFYEEMEVDLSGLDPEKKARTLKFAQQSINNNCTIGNTVAKSAEVSDVQFVQPH